MAHIHVSWFDPHKIRKVTLVGSNKMATFDNMDPNEKIRIYDKGVDMAGSVVGYEQSLAIRSGDMLIPKTPGREPLRIECLHFLECIEKQKAPRRPTGTTASAWSASIDAATRSLKASSAPVNL